jgi:hypothetical protein
MSAMEPLDSLPDFPAGSRERKGGERLELSYVSTSKVQLPVERDSTPLFKRKHDD